MCGKKIPNRRTYCSRECQKKDKNYKTCVICGTVFADSPSNKRVTCGSPDCIRENKSRKHAGITYKWSDEAKLRVPKVQNENLKKGTYAAQQSPIAGRFETNRNAKKWILIDPDGKEHHCQNLMEWARNNCELFGKEP